MEFAIITGLILLNGLFAMSEIAIISARRTSLNADAKYGSKSAKTALKLIDNPDHFLSTIQVGITLIGIITGLYSGDVLTAHFAPTLEKAGMSTTYAYPVAKGLIVIVVTYLTIIFGELMPKRIGMAAAEKVSKAIARPMYWLSIIVYPFVWLLSKSTSGLFRLFGLKDKGTKVTEEEIKSLLREGAEGGEVQEMEQDIVERVFTLGDRNLESIMTHRTNIVWIEASMTKEEIKSVIEETPFDKYPVGNGNLDEIIGVAFIKDMFLKIDSDDFDIRKIAHPAEYLYENMEVYIALEKMKTEHIQCALVSDEFGSVKGLVTLIDIMEALVGDIPNAGEEPDIVERAEGGYLVEGQCLFYDFLRYFDLTELFHTYDYNTLSGLILKQLGNIPKTGEIIYWHGLKFEIVDMDGARIDKVLVTVNRD